MTQRSRESHAVFLVAVGLVAWIVPGAGHFMLNLKRRAAIMFVTILVTFCIGLYVGSIGVIDPAGAKPWYVAQIMNSPAVLVLGRLSTAGDYAVYGRANEIGQIYTSIAGLLNLLCIVNAVYIAHLRGAKTTGD